MDGKEIQGFQALPPKTHRGAAKNGKKIQNEKARGLKSTCFEKRKRAHRAREGEIVRGRS